MTVEMLGHPDVPLPSSHWSENETLHVAVAYSNPFRWHTRRKLLNDFRRHMAGFPNIKLYIGELALGDRPFEVTHPNPHDLQIAARTEMFHKENILNEIIRHKFPVGWKYGAYIDGDFTFTRHDWALESIHQMQHSPFVQLFSTYADTSARTYGGERCGQIRKSFAATYIDNGHCLLSNAGAASPAGWADCYRPWVPCGATGGAWSFTASAYETVGGLLDVCILGHADWFMAFGLINEATRGDIALSPYHPRYTDAIVAWQARAAKLGKNIGVVDQFAVHHFHGSKKNRGYETRDKILSRYQFDPTRDLYRNRYGIYELTEDKPGLRDAIRRYFISRNEDNPND